jgi:FixJ family two-component response regulator
MDAIQAIEEIKSIYGTLDRRFRQYALDNNRPLGEVEREIAELLDVSPRTVSNYRNGTTEMPLASLEKVIDFLGL